MVLTAAATKAATTTASPLLTATIFHRQVGVRCKVVHGFASWRELFQGASAAMTAAASAASVPVVEVIGVIPGICVGGPCMVDTGRSDDGREKETYLFGHGSGSTHGLTRCADPYDVESSQQSMGRVCIWPMSVSSCCGMGCYRISGHRATMISLLLLSLTSPLRPLVSLCLL